MIKFCFQTTIAQNIGKLWEVTTKLLVKTNTTIIVNIKKQVTMISYYQVIKDTNSKVISREVLIHMVHGQLHHSLAIHLLEDNQGHQDSRHQVRHHMVEDMDKHQQVHHRLRHTQLPGDRHHTLHLPRLGHLQDIMEIIVRNSVFYCPCHFIAGVYRDTRPWLFIRSQKHFGLVKCNDIVFCVCLVNL